MEGVKSYEELSADLQGYVEQQKQVWARCQATARRAPLALPPLHVPPVSMLGACRHSLDICKVHCLT